MEEFLENFKTKKNLIRLVVLGILILAIPVGIKILQQQQIIKSRATADLIVFTGDNVSRQDGKWVAKKPQISLELISPLGPPAGSIPPAPSRPPSSNCPNKLIFGLSGPVSDKIKQLYTTPSIRFLAVSWGNIQPTQTSSYDFSNVDREVNEAIANGQTPAVKFCDGDCFPNWARQMDKDIDRSYCCSTDYVCRVLKEDSTTAETFKAVVSAMVSRYKDKITYWDYGIEPNCRGYNPGMYTQWLKLFAEAARSADSKAVIIGGHLSGGNNDYLRAMYASGAGPYFDRIAIDPYGQPLDTGAIDGVRNIMVSNGDSDKKIWLGEWAINTSDVSEERQADLVGQGLSYLATIPWIEAAFYHNYECDIGIFGCSPGSNGYLGMGILRGDNSEKPAYNVFKNAVSACLTR